MRWVFLISLLATGCDGKTDGGDSGDSGAGDSGDSGGGDSGDSGTDAVCTEPTDVPCVDEMILDLSLHDDMVSDGEVTTTTEGSDYLTQIDASAGGYNQSANNPWVYVRFDADGAHRVDIDDETALESMDWDMALRRYIVRLNGGDSGPSCVGAAAMMGWAYADLAKVPSGINFQLDDFYTADCTITEDTSGLPGSPAVAMGSWWDYPGCVETTFTPFLIQRADGTVIKLVIEKYYADDGQDECNANGSTTASGGFFQVRWAYM